MASDDATLEMCWLSTAVSRQGPPTALKLADGAVDRELHGRTRLSAAWNHVGVVAALPIPTGSRL